MERTWERRWGVLGRFTLALAVLGMAALLGACARTAAPKGGVAVEGAWARPGEKGGTSAVYFTVRNTGRADDRLVGASTDVAGEVSLHETVAEGSAAAPGLVFVSHEGAGEGGDMAGMEHDQMPAGGGMMRMRPVEAVPVPAGKTVEFKPGGLHVMLMDLKRDLKAGDTFSLTLRFEKAGAVPVEVTVRQP